VRALAFALLLLAAPVVARAQVKVSSWATELVAGAGLDLAARGPWMAESWRESAVLRVTWSTSASLVYEYAVEPWNGYTNAGRWQDVGQRLVGTLALELLAKVLR